MLVGARNKTHLLGLLPVLILFLSACLPLARPINDRDPLGTALAPPTDNTMLPTPPCFSTYYDPFAFSPDSTRLLVKATGGVQIFNLQAMQEQQFITAPTSLPGSAVDLSPDGSTLAWALEGGTIQVLRLSDLRILTTIHSQQPGMLKLKFSPLGDRLYSASRYGSQGGSLIAWGLDGKRQDTFQPGGELVNFALSPDGNTLATIPADGPVALWSVDGFTRLSDLGGSGGYDTSAAAFSPDGQLLAVDLATGLHVWRLSDGSELLGSQQAINSMAVAFSPDGKTLAYGSGSSIVLAAPDGSRVIRTLEGHRSTVFQLLFSPDSARLVSADDIDIRLWRVEDGQLLNIGNSICAYK